MKLRKPQEHEMLQSADTMCYSAGKHEHNRPDVVISRRAGLHD